MIWAIDLDDFKSFCSNKTFPLTRMIATSLKELNRNKCANLQKVVDIDLMEYTSKVTKWTFGSNEKINPLDDKFNYLPDSFKPKTTTVGSRSSFKRLFFSIPNTSPATSSSSKQPFLTIRFRPHLNHRETSTASRKLIAQNKPIVRPTAQQSNYKLITTTKNNIYMLSRSDKKNTIFLAFQSAKLKNDQIIDQVLSEPRTHTEYIYVLKSFFSFLSFRYLNIS